MGSAHKSVIIQCLINHAKNSKKMYRILLYGYTVDRKNDSTANCN